MTRRFTAAVLAVALLLCGSASAASPPAPAAVQPTSTGAGANVAEGSPADTAYAGSGSASMVAALKGLYAAFQNAATAAGQTLTNTALGSTTDAPISGAASTTAATLQAEIKGLYNLLQAGTAKTQGAVFYTDANAQSVAASAVLGPFAHSTGGASGGGQQFGYFTSTVTSTQAGTLYVFLGSENYQVTVTANTPTSIKVPAFAASVSTQFNNNSTAGTVSLYSGFTLN